MSDAGPHDDAPPARPAASPCRHLRHAGMYVHTDGTGDEPRDGYDSASCWCLKTMKPFGPDNDFVGRTECRDPSRTCYEAF